MIPMAISFILTVGLYLVFSWMPGVAAHGGHGGMLLSSQPTAYPTHAACSPGFGFTFVPAFGTFADLQGSTSCLEPSQYNVAVYIYVSAWWSKPAETERLTEIDDDGSWTTDITTGGIDHQAIKVAAFLVPADYEPPLALGEATLPSELYSNAIAHAVARREPRVRTVEFSGYTWIVKESELAPVGPGPNFFSDDEQHIWVDEQGRLHLTLAEQDGRWYATEVIAQDSLGYGTYTFGILGRADDLDKHVVLGLFTWDDAAPQYHYREIDIEFGRWGVQADENAQYVVQPWDNPGNRHRFDVVLDSGVSAHSFDWQPDQIRFFSVDSSGVEIKDWLYRQTQNIPPAGSETARINLWLLDGVSPSDGKPVEVVIDSFEFTPFQPP